MTLTQAIRELVKLQQLASKLPERPGPHPITVVRTEDGRVVGVPYMYVNYTHLPDIRDGRSVFHVVTT